MAMVLGAPVVELATTRDSDLRELLLRGLAHAADLRRQMDEAQAQRIAAAVVGLIAGSG